MTKPESPSQLRYMTLEQIRTKLGGRSRSSIYRDVELGRLPAPIKFGARLYWVESDVDAAIASLAE